MSIVSRRKYSSSNSRQAYTKNIEQTSPPRLESKIVIMSIINIISFIVTAKQLYVDVSWNMKVRIRNPDLLFSCSVHTENFLLEESECCRRSVKAGVAKMYANNQLNERYVLCFIIIGGISAFALLFIIGGFCVGYRSKYRNILMHPIFSVGTFAHLTNCFLFVFGFILRLKDQSKICDAMGPTKAKHSKVLECLKQVLPCEDMDMNFKYWFLFSVAWVLIGIVLLVFFYQSSKQFLHGLFTCGPHPRKENAVHPVSTADETVVTTIR